MNDGNYKIDTINYKDFIPMLKLFRAFYDESHGKDVINFDVDSVIHFLNEIIDDPSIHLGLKCILGDEIIGFFFGSISSMSFSSTKIGFERGFFVQKESRGSRAAYLLRDAYDAWAKEKGAKVTIDVIFHSDNNEITYRFMEKSGRRAVGKVFERIL